MGGPLVSQGAKEVADDLFTDGGAIALALDNPEAAGGRIDFEVDSMIAGPAAMADTKPFVPENERDVSLELARGERQ